MKTLGPFRKFFFLINLGSFLKAQNITYYDNSNEEYDYYEFDGDNLHHPSEDNKTYRELVKENYCTQLHRFACLMTNYKLILPPRPVNNLVKVFFEIIDFPEINDNKLTMTLVMELVLEWQEPRLILDPLRDKKITIDSQGLKMLWIPNVVFDRQHKLTQISTFQDSRGAVVLDDEIIRFWAFIEVTVYCSMSFEHFPMDEQICKFVLSSTSSPMEIVRFESEVSTSRQEPRLQNYLLEIESITDPNELRFEYPSGNYSLCGFNVRMKRQASTYILIYYVPCTGMVLVSWISFLVDPNVVPGRTALLVTIFLVLTTIFSGIQRDTPRSHGLTALGQYALVCLTFVFLAMIEFAVLLFLKRFSSHKQTREAKKQVPSNPWGLISNQEQAKVSKRSISWLSDVDSFSYWIDQGALVIFPFGFAVFNLVHFTQYN